MTSDTHPSPGRSLWFWIWIGLWLLPFLLFTCLFALAAAMSAAGFTKTVLSALTLVFFALTWVGIWHGWRQRASARYLAALRSGTASLVIVRPPHLAIAATTIAVALLVIAVCAALEETLHPAVSILLWLPAIAAGVGAFVYGRRCGSPLILSASGLTDRTARLDDVAWSRLVDCRVSATRGISRGVFIEIKPERGWDERRRTVEINCLDLAAHPEDVLIMFEQHGAQKLKR